MLKASKYEASHKIRFLRVVTDDDVDRMQVYRQRCHSRALLIARSLLVLPCMGDIYIQFIYFLHHVCLIQVTIALRFHLFPFRTEKLSSVTPMVLRNSGRVGSRRFFRERSPCIGRCRGFLVLGLSFRTEKLSSFVCLALFCLLFFSLFCLFSWGQQIFSGDYSYTCEVFFFAFRILYRITLYPYHIIYLASISSYVFLFLSLKVTLLCA